jgi:hypothetical protein
MLAAPALVSSAFFSHPCNMITMKSLTPSQLGLLTNIMELKFSAYADNLALA